MRDYIERKALIHKLLILFPEGVTNTSEMAFKLKEEGVMDVALTRVSILSRKKGKTNFVVSYLASHYIDKKGEINNDPFSGNQILEHPTIWEIQSICGEINQLGRLDLNNFRNANLTPGKISPLDIPRLAVRHFRARHFFISDQTISLAEAGVDVILPQNQIEFEIRTLEEVVKELRTQLEFRKWHKIHPVF